MGLNGGIIKHPNIAGFPSAAAASRRIDDDLGGRGIPGRKKQPDGPGQANCDPD